MSKFAALSAALLMMFCFSACGLFDKNDDKSQPNVIGGDTNLPLNAVDNEFTTSAVVGGQYVNLGASIKVTKNEEGVTTLKVTADLSKTPSLQALDYLIPAGLKDATGKINTEVKYKITSEGIQDYFNKDGKPHTIVKYDCKVGDEYQLGKSDGKIITRTVTGVSTTDDFPYGFMLIKTITVEQDSRIPGISKFIYKANHKFGLVHFQVVMADGSTAGTYIYPTNY